MMYMSFFQLQIVCLAEPKFLHQMIWFKQKTLILCYAHENDSTPTKSIYCVIIRASEVIHDDQTIEPSVQATYAYNNMRVGWVIDANRFPTENKIM